MDKIIQEASRIQSCYGAKDLDSVAHALGMAIYDVLESEHVKEVYFPALQAVALRPDLPRHERRYLIAHALGHHVLHRAHKARDYIGRHAPLPEEASDEQRAEISRAESEAELFAAYLLIPESQLCSALRQGWVKRSKDPVTDLAVELRVPPEAVRARLVFEKCRRLQRQEIDQALGQEAQ